MTYTEQLKEEAERKEYVQVTVRSPVNPSYLEAGWVIVSQELPVGMATLRKALPKCACSQLNGGTNNHVTRGKA